MSTRITQAIISTSSFVVSLIGSIILSLIGSFPEFIYLFYTFSFLPASVLRRTSIIVFIVCSTCVYVARAARNLYYLLHIDKTYPGAKRTLVTGWVITAVAHFSVGVWCYTDVHYNSIEIVIKVSIWTVCVILSHIIDILLLAPGQSGFNILFPSAIRKTLQTPEECFICGEQQITQVVRLQCGHQIHQPCFQEWYGRGHDTCPLCRYNVSLLA